MSAQKLRKWSVTLMVVAWFFAVIYGAITIKAPRIEVNELDVTMGVFILTPAVLSLVFTYLYARAVRKELND